MSNTARRVSTRLTAPLRTLLVVCSVVFVIGSAVPNSAMIDEQAIVDVT
jgi:hypothetical protein